MRVGTNAACLGTPVEGRPTRGTGLTRRRRTGGYEVCLVCRFECRRLLMLADVQSVVHLVDSLSYTSHQAGGLGSGCRISAASATQVTLLRRIS